MEAYHCNRCGHLPLNPGSGQRKYFLTSCHHVICSFCMISVNGLQDTQNGKCPMCKILCTMTELNTQADPETKALFMEPLAIVSEALKKCEDIARFQKNQRKSFNNLMNQMGEAYRKSLAENMGLKIKLEAAQVEIVELKRRIDLMEQEPTFLQTSYATNAESHSMFETPAPAPPGFSRTDKHNSLFSNESWMNFSDFM